MENNLCPCGSQKTFADCCGPFLKGVSQPKTPEALMRSRYSAFAVKDMDYIRKTTDPQTASQFDFSGNRKWADDCDFNKLEVLASSEDANKGMVEFKATYFSHSQNKEEIHHEVSKFRKQAGVWYYRDGKVRSAEASQ